MGKSSEQYIAQRAWEQDRQDFESREADYLYARYLKERAAKTETQPKGTINKKSNQ